MNLRATSVLLLVNDGGEPVGLADEEHVAGEVHDTPHGPLRVVLYEPAKTQPRARKGRK